LLLGWELLRQTHPDSTSFSPTREESFIQSRDDSFREQSRAEVLEERERERERERDENQR